ncbi:Rho GTPase activation protein [Hortaea werneckii]|nr:Rho GTPase activation protein [Hortaea werneckii]
MEPGRRQRWNDQRRVKEANLYDEWLKEEREAERQAQQAQQQQQQEAQVQAPPRRQSTPMSSSVATGGSTTGSARAVTPEEQPNRHQHHRLHRHGHAPAVDTERASQRSGLQDEGEGEGSPGVSDRGTSSFERAFIPFGPQSLGTTTTIVGGPAATPSSPVQATSPPSKSRRVAKERESDNEARVASQNSPSVTQKSGSLRSAGGMPGRSSSKNHGRHAAKESSSNPARPRTRTLDESTRRRERSPNALLKSRNRIGSVHSPSLPVYHGADYLASVPAATSPPAAPSIHSVGSPVQGTAEYPGSRSISPISTETAQSMAPGLPPTNAKRIVYLMKTLRGTMSGSIVFRRDRTSPWSQCYCYVKENDGRLMYEPRGGEGSHHILVSDLRGCSVVPSVEDETPYLEVSFPHSDSGVHVKLQTQSDFDSWFATFLWWHSPSQKPLEESTAAVRQLASSRSVTARPEPPPRKSSARRHRASSSKSDRRKSTGAPLKEAPVIKIGKMVFWDTNIGYSSGSTANPPSTTRPAPYRMQSYASRRWRRISGQLRENGELKLHSDLDNTLISVVQLSQLSRCAIQRLDPSVLENDFCIAIYPQYTSNLNNSQPGFLRPIFLSLENRVLYEVWFVLLRAFTMPQLYGPPTPSQNGEPESPDASTNDMFRVERSLSIRIVEAKMYPPLTSTAPTSPGSGFSGGHAGGHGSNTLARPELHGYYAEVLLDNETRGKTAVKYEGLTPLWGESFDFADLPPVLNNISVVIKRRPPDNPQAREQQESKMVHEAYGLKSDYNGGYTGLTFDMTCGKVEIYMQELEEEKEVERWWPVVTHNQQVGEVLIKARAEEGVVLMAHDYQPLGDLLHRFSNALTLQIATLFPNDLKRLSDCLLNIFQVSGTVSDWLSALVEEEIDGIHKETPLSRLRYSRRVGSDATNETAANIGHSSDRELIVRDLNKNATLEANLLFRGNTLLTKSLDTHMRRVGREYLEESLGPKLKEINEKDPNCEVDPNRVDSQQDLERNWRRLMLFTQEVWKVIVSNKAKCPVELRMIFRHIRACAEDRYGDFLRTVSYSSVSGFLFLRFFCPAVLNPKLFGLLKDDIKPRARRTFTLIAKSLQTMANMASFGTKEHWMEPMNAFLTQHRESFKAFIDDICYVPTALSGATAGYTGSPVASPTYAPGVVSAETNLSYTTPMTIMQRLPPTSREGFPSLPYLIDQARAYADLVNLWLEITSPQPTSDAVSTSSSRLSDTLNAIHASGGDLLSFHEICTTLDKRSKECLSRAERAERPNSALGFRWEELIDQLQNTTTNETSDEVPSQTSYDTVADKIAGGPSILPAGMDSRMSSDYPPRRRRNWEPATDEEEEDDDVTSTSNYNPTASTASTPMPAEVHFAEPRESRDRPSSAGRGSSFHGSIRRVLHSRGSDHSPNASATTSAISSAVSSDTEHTTGTTALPSYEREVRHRERREAARQQIQQQMEEAKVREQREKERKKVKMPLAALRKRRDKESAGASGEGGTGTGAGGGGGRSGGGVRRGVDMSHV